MKDQRTIQEKFDAFNEENPIVYSLFKQQALKAINKGKTKISAKALIEFIRWEIQFQVTAEDFKINNSFTSRFARKFVEDFEYHKDVFEFRTLSA